MSDRMNDVLAAIDAETAKCICGREVPADGPSLDYCSDVCQYGYTAQQVGTEADDEYSFHINQGPTDGRTINEDVNAWFADTADASDDEGPFEWPPDSLGADLQRLSEATRELGRAISEPFARITSAISADLDRAENMRTLEVVVPDENERTAYLDACEGSPGIALEYASFGVPAVHVRDLRETGVTAMQYTVTVCEGNQQ
jgi:hypothetical protein